MFLLFLFAALPDQGPPKISGGRPRYQIGDWVRINCTAGRSKPAVNLSWFINSEPAEPQKLRKYDTIVSGREGLETSVLGLQFRVEQQHFRNGDMKLKVSWAIYSGCLYINISFWLCLQCVASLSTFYWRSNEESVEGDRPQKAPVLESRESDSAFASNSRADPVQGMSYRELFVTKILSLFIQPNAASKTDSLLMARAPSALLLLALATAATLAGVSCGSPWPASTQHSKPVAGASTKSVANVNVANEPQANDTQLDQNQKQKQYPNQNQNENQVKQAGQAKRVVVAELLAAAKQKLKRFVRQLQCSVSDAAATQQPQQQQQQQHQQQQQLLLAAR